jgi:hypothetical protein
MSQVGHEESLKQALPISQTGQLGHNKSLKYVITCFSKRSQPISLVGHNSVSIMVAIRI